MTIASSTRSFINKALLIQIYTIKLVLKSYYLIKLPPIKRLIVRGLKGLLIGGLGFIRVFNLLKVSLRLVNLVLSIIL